MEAGSRCRAPYQTGLYGSAEVAPASLQAREDILAALDFENHSQTTRRRLTERGGHVKTRSITKTANPRRPTFPCAISSGQPASNMTGLPDPVPIAKMRPERTHRSSCNAAEGQICQPPITPTDQAASYSSPLHPYPASGSLTS